MKYLLSSLLLFATVAYSQIAKDLWKPLLQDADIATYFSGMWESMGITIEETGEKITVLHHGDHFELKDGVESDKVDYDLTLVGKNITDMSMFGEDHKIDETESFRIMKTLFTPFVRASLQHPMMRKEFQMNLAGLEKHVHVYLNGPTKEYQATHTMMFVNDQWMVIEGIHGNAARVFELTVDDAIEYQREAFMAQKADTRKSWKRYKKFYLKWRKEVSYEVCMKCGKKLEKGKKHKD